MDLSKQKGGFARAAALSAERRSEIARAASAVRWGESPAQVAYVYALGIEGGPIKIGWASDALRRMRAVQVGNHLPLALMHSIKVPRWEAQQVEARAHRLLAEFALSGEWFDVSPSVALQALLDAKNGRDLEVDPELTVVKSVRMTAANWAYIAERAKKREISPNAWITRMVTMLREDKLKEVK